MVRPPVAATAVAQTAAHLADPRCGAVVACDAAAHGTLVVAAGAGRRPPATAAPGRPPRRARLGGAREQLAFGLAPCSLGRVLVATSDRGVVAVLLGDADAALRAELVARFARADCMPAAAPLRRAMAAVVRCVDGQGRDPGLPLDLRGTAFQQRLWALLGTIPAGTTVSYQDLATRLSMPAGARAVAAACAANPVAVLVPCHRVVRADGGLAGYRWGLDRKRALLARERGQG